MAPVVPNPWLERFLFGYYWCARPLLIAVYALALFKGRAFVHPLDIVVIALLWCFPYWIRLRLLPATEKRDPALYAELKAAVERIDGTRAESKLPWVRARP